MAVDGRIILRHVTVKYGRRVALEGVTGEFAAGSLTAVVGSNGAGKSTLLGAIAGTVRLAAGSVERPALERIAYLPQLAAIDTTFPLTVLELIILGAWRDLGAFKAPEAPLRNQANAAASAVGLADRLRTPLGALSVGELQRALFARLILQDAAVILLDEPFASVDPQSMSLLLDQIAHWHEEARTIVAVLHDLELVRARFPATLVLDRRCIAWGKTQTVLAS